MDYVDAFVLLALRECRYVASHGGSKQNRNRIESTIERISHDRNTTRVAPFHIYIYTYKLNNFYTYKVHRCASFFKFQFPFISVYPYYHICVTKIDNGMILCSPPVSANFTQIVNNPPSS